MKKSIRAAVVAGTLALTACAVPPTKPPAVDPKKELAVTWCAEIDTLGPTEARRRLVNKVTGASQAYIQDVVEHAFDICYEQMRYYMP